MFSPHPLCLDPSVIMVVVSRGNKIEYIDIGESSVEAAGREELTHFRQDPPYDFTDPSQGIVTKPGAKRRTTISREPLIDNGPRRKDGRRTGWYVYIDVATNETNLVSVESAAELANLPQDALPAREYCNLLAQENPSLAANFVDFLDKETAPHTAHHTRGSDHGVRTKTIFARDKLSHLSHQDKQIGSGIKVPPVRRRPRDPSTLVGADKVEW